MTHWGSVTLGFCGSVRHGMPAVDRERPQSNALSKSGVFQGTQEIGISSSQFGKTIQRVRQILSGSCATGSRTSGDDGYAMRSIKGYTPGANE